MDFYPSFKSQKIIFNSLPNTYLIDPETVSVGSEQRCFRENSLMSGVKDALLDFLAS